MSEEYSGGLTLEEEAFIRRKTQELRDKWRREMLAQIEKDVKEINLGDSIAWRWYLGIRNYGSDDTENRWNPYTYPSA